MRNTLLVYTADCRIHLFHLHQPQQVRPMSTTSLRSVDTRWWFGSV